MNILITGSSGFLSKEFKRYFSNHNVFNVSRENLKNFDCLKKTIIDNNIDFILHTSWAGVINKSTNDLQFNIQIHNNLEKCSKFVKLIFLFGSGAELFKDVSSDYCKGKLYVLNNAKNYSNMINLRLYGCFGKFEDEKRFIKNSVNRIIRKELITIDSDKFMDFIFVEDLCLIIETYMLSLEGLPRNLDCVYLEKYKLTDIAKYLNNLFNLHELNYNLLKGIGLSEPYIGSGTELDSLGLNLQRLKKGILKLYGQEAENFRLSS